MITPDQLLALLPDADPKAIKGAIPSQEHLEAIENLDALYDALMAKGKFKITEDQLRRDPNEPHRTIKEAFEDKIEKLIKRLFRGQRKRVFDMFERNLPFFNRMTEPPKIEDENLKDDDIESSLILIFLAMALDANEIFVTDTNIPLEEYSKNALIAARVAVGDLIRNINTTTKARIQEAVALFVETPGMTLGQLAKMLPFDDYRARLIAVTEVSNIYGEMVIRDAELLQKEFPNMYVYRKWYTNHDDRVCEICKGLDGKEASATGSFISSFDGGEYYKPGDPHPGDRCWTSVGMRKKE